MSALAWTPLLFIVGLSLWYRQFDIAKILLASLAYYVALMLSDQSIWVSSGMATLFGMTLIVCCYLYREVQPWIARIILAFLVIMTFAMGGVVDEVGRQLGSIHEANSLAVWVMLAVPAPLAATAVGIQLRNPLGVD